MPNQENKCIKLQQDYQKLVQTKQEFDVLFTEVKKEKVTTDNINQIKPKIKVAIIKKQEIKDKLKEIKEQFDQRITGIHEGREIKISLSEQIKYWNQFYQDYDIKDEKGNLCQLPANLKLTPQTLTEAQMCIDQYGFDKILMIPAGISPQSLIDNKKFLIFQGSTEDNQNSDKSDPIWINDDIKASTILSQKTDQAQVILLKDKKEMDSEADETIQRIKRDNKDLLTNIENNYRETTRNYTYPEIIAMEKHLSLEGLDLVQAMILDRQYFNQTNSHLFDWNKNNATWLTKTKNQMITGQCSRFLWDPDNRQWLVALSDDSFCGGNLGSVFTRSLETTGEN